VSSGVQPLQLVAAAMLRKADMTANKAGENDVAFDMTSSLIERPKKQDRTMKNGLLLLPLTFSVFF
jgi:hypothetical protein